MSGPRSARLITGDGGSGKTSQLANYFEWVWRVHHKKSRLYTADGGAYGDKMDTLIQLGIVEVWRLRTRFGAGGEDLVEETFTRASKGWWPRTFTGPGETLPGTELVAPTVVTYSLYCSNGHLVKTSPVYNAMTPTICPECKQTATPQAGKVEKTSRLADHMAGVGCCGFEGLTSWSTIQLNSLRARRAKGQLHGEKSALGSFQSGEEKYDGNNRADFGFAQGEAETWVQNTTTIPGLVVDPVWTALESQSDETGTRLPLWTPKIAGQARGGEVPQWFGDWIGLQKVEDEKGRLEWRLYLAEFRGGDRLPHRYKVRAQPGFMPAFLADVAGGEAFSGCNVGLYLDLVQAAQKASIEKARTLYPDAPALGGQVDSSTPAPVVQVREGTGQATTNAPVPAVPGKPGPVAVVRPAPPKPVGRPPAVARPQLGPPKKG